MKGSLKLVTFSRGTSIEYYEKGAMTTGYASPEEFLKPYRWWANNDEHWHVKPGEAEGVPVIDMREAVATEEGIKMVFRGPMVNVDLPNGEVSYCPEPSPLLANAVVNNEFGSLFKLQAAHKAVSTLPGPLDSVSISQFIAMWRDVGGRIGVIHGDQIVWESEMERK